MTETSNVEDGTHRTPNTLDKWHQIAATALSTDPANIRRVGPLKEGSKGAYASRRVWWLDIHGLTGEHTLRSSEIVACDEPMDARDRVDLGPDEVYWPYGVWGCGPGCGRECERHGEAWERGI